LAALVVVRVLEFPQAGLPIQDAGIAGQPNPAHLGGGAALVVRFQVAQGDGQQAARGLFDDAEITGELDQGWRVGHPERHGEAGGVDQGAALVVRQSVRQLEGESGVGGERSGKGNAVVAGRGLFRLALAIGLALGVLEGDLVQEGARDRRGEFHP
jgi:hypothetical protein